MKRILVIEDDVPLRLTIKAMLRKHGYEVLEAQDGQAGLETARTQLPDLVLSDINMAGTDGFGVLKELRSDPATSAIPVILMTGVPESSGARFGMDQGADDYLAKPFEMAALLAAIRARLERQEAIEIHAKGNEKTLLEILATTPDLVAIADANSGRLQYLNASGRRLLAFGPREEIAELRLEDFPADAQTAALQQERVAWAKRHGNWVGESVLADRQGQRVPVSEQILAHRSPQGEVLYLSIVARDITGRLAAERERQMMEVQLRQAQKLEAIGQLASGIAHEINTPTQYVGDNTRFLQDSFENIRQVLQAHEELRRAAKGNTLTPEIIARAEQASAAGDLEYLFAQIPAAITETLEGVGRISKIVRAMKEFSHPGGKEKTLANVNKAVESTVTVARNEWKYVADMNLDLDPDLPGVPCFLGEFNQAVLNLVINAAHAIGDVVAEHPGSKGLITVRTRRDGDYVEVQVSDTGAGIPEAIRPRIFEPFFTTKPVGKGTGQGLSIVYGNVVKKHGGTVRFESAAGKGTTFILRLPLTPGTEDNSAA